MPRQIISILHVSLTTANLRRAHSFFTEALGFDATEPPQQADPALASLLGARHLRAQKLQRGRQALELAEFEPPGAAYFSARDSNDLAFQHIAIVASDMATAYAALCRHPHEPISRHGPQTLPGGIIAYKFRDPEGHPLELIQFPAANPATENGIDHSAISVSDAQRSIEFYTGTMGLTVAARQSNTGPAQDALDNLDGVTVDVVALAPKIPAPHLELLGYRMPPGRLAPILRPSDIAATRLVCHVNELPTALGVVSLRNGVRAALIHDPDGHALLLTTRNGQLAP